MLFTFKNTEIKRPPEYKKTLEIAAGAISRGGPEEGMPSLRKYKEENGETAAITAIKIGDTENIEAIVDLLLMLNLNPKKNPVEMLLNRSIQEGQAGVASILAEKMKKNGGFKEVYEEMESGHLLVEAVKHSQKLTEKGLKGTEIVEKLIGLGLDVNKSYDKKGNTPLAQAILNDPINSKVIDLLLRNVAKIADHSVQKAVRKFKKRQEDGKRESVQGGAVTPAEPGTAPQPVEGGAAQRSGELNL